MGRVGRDISFSVTTVTLQNCVELHWPVSPSEEERKEGRKRGEKQNNQPSFPSLSLIFSWAMFPATQYSYRLNPSPPLRFALSSLFHVSETAQHLKLMGRGGEKNVA